MSAEATGRRDVSAVRRVVVGLVWSAAMIAALMLVVISRLDPTGLFVTAAWPIIFLALAVDVVAYASVGATLALRRPANLMGGLLLAAGSLIGFTFLAFIGGGLLAQLRGPTDLLAALAALGGGLTINATLIVAGAAPALFFPDGRLPGPRWRWPVGVLVGAAVLASLPNLVRPGPLGEGMAQNPFGVAGAPSVDALLSVADVLDALTLPAALALAVVAVIVRFRRSRGPERQQVKWFVAANLAVAVCLMVSIADGGGDPTLPDILAIVSLSLPPFAIGIAILRYRLYEIDRLISRSLSWAVVTGVLVATFAAGVIGLQAALQGFTQGETLAVAASTLVVFALFQPVRRRVQAVVDRRFDRARHDGQQVVDTFARHLRDEVDLDRLRSAFVATADDVVRPVSASLWLRSSESAR